MKREVLEKTRLAHRLIYILQDEIDDLRLDVNKHNIGELLNDIEKLNSTMNDVIDTVVELERAVILYKLDRTRDKHSL